MTICAEILRRFVSYGPGSDQLRSYLEKLDWKPVEKNSPAGVYLICGPDLHPIKYVGSSTDPWTRTRTHIRNKIGTTALCFPFPNDSERLAIEEAIIAHVKPPYNRIVRQPTRYYSLLKLRLP